MHAIGILSPYQSIRFGCRGLRTVRQLKGEYFGICEEDFRRGIAS